MVVRWKREAGILAVMSRNDDETEDDDMVCRERVPEVEAVLFWSG